MLCKTHPGSGSIRKSLQYKGIRFHESDDIQGCLTLNDITLTSSIASLRAVSKICKLYPEDIEDAAIVDEWLEMHHTFITPIVMVTNQDEVVPWRSDIQYKKWLSEVHIPFYLRILEQELDRSVWFGGMTSMTIADLRWYETLTWLDHGCLEEVNAKNLDEYPAIRGYMISFSAALSGLHGE